MRLGNVLHRTIRPIDKAERPLDGLNVIGKISFAGTFHLRDAVSKNGYKGPLFEARPGELVLSKIRVAQGSFGLVPDTLNHLAVSPEYPVYSLNPEQVEQSFLALAIRSPEFVGGLSVSGNTTKQRIKSAAFEDLAIPLPPLDEQRALVAAHAAAIERAAADEAEAAAVERAGAQAFADALGLSAPPPPPDCPAFIARFATSTAGGTRPPSAARPASTTRPPDGRSSAWAT